MEAQKTLQDIALEFTKMNYNTSDLETNPYYLGCMAGLISQEVTVDHMAKHIDEVTEELEQAQALVAILEKNVHEINGTLESIREQRDMFRDKSIDLEKLHEEALEKVEHYKNEAHKWQLEWMDRGIKIGILEVSVSKDKDRFLKALETCMYYSDPFRVHTDLDYDIIHKTAQKEIQAK